MTESRKAVLISNPSAGRDRAKRASEIERFCETLRSGGVEIESHFTSGPGDAAQLARTLAANGTSDVIISGGDGTINEALQGLVGAKVNLAIWPSGTANVLAREIGMPSSPEGAAEIIARGKTKRIFVGRATSEETGEQRYFLLMAGIGLDASIVERVNPALKRRFGKAAFWYSGLSHLARWQPISFQVEVNGESITATFAAIGNAPRYGGDISVTPNARLDQPEFEIAMITSRNRVRYLQLLSRAMRRTPALIEEHDFRLVRATSARVTGEVAVQVDGELIGRPPMTFAIAPDPINIVFP